MTLFNDSETFQKERPRTLPEEIKQEFLLRVARECVEEGYSEDSEQCISEDLRRIFPFSETEFEMAKTLEQRGGADYDFSVFFIEWLGSLYREYRDELQKLEETWVKAHNIKPKFQVGECKTLKHGMSGFKAGAGLYVISHIENTGKYVLNEDKNGNGGRVIPYEIFEASVIE